MSSFTPNVRQRSTRISSRSDRHPSSSRRWLTASGVGLVVLFAGLWYYLSNQRIVLSEPGYELSKAIFAACNLEDTKRIRSAMAIMAQLPLAADERKRMTRVMELANNGQWQSASDLARNLLESQTRP